MNEPLYLSRITLKHSPEISPLIDVLQPREEGLTLATDHRLMWSIMPPEIQDRHEEKKRAGDRTSPFLWRREQGKGRYYLLGPEPVKDSSLFAIETKPFEAALSGGDRLQFVLRVNATVDRRIEGRNGARQRRDIVMDLLHGVPKGERAGQRQDLAAKATQDWLAARGPADGFKLEALVLDGYRAAPVDRGARKPGRIGILDLRGVLTVQDVEAFLARLRCGFGRSKAFGCGLMLIRRAG